MKKIEAWKTDDGKVWETEAAADMHEKRITGENLIRGVYWTGMVECESDLVTFLEEYRITVLRFYGIEEK